MVVLQSVSFPFDEDFPPSTRWCFHPSPRQRVTRFFGHNRKCLITTFLPVIFMKQLQMVEMNNLAIISIDTALDVVVEVRQNLNNLVWATPTALQLMGAFLSSWHHKKHDLCDEGKADAADLPVVEELATGASLMDLFCNMGSCSIQPLYDVMAAILGRVQLSSKVKLSFNRKCGITAEHKEEGGGACSFMHSDLIGTKDIQKLVPSMACSIKLKHYSAGGISALDIWRMYPYRISADIQLDIHCFYLKNFMIQITFAAEPLPVLYAPLRFITCFGMVLAAASFLLVELSST
ncbi:hypothetical protein QOT17_023399 [Balamuthia mandrillaris]